MRRIVMALALVACDEGGGGFESTSTSTTPPTPGSASGFSADLAKSFGSGSNAKPDGSNTVAVNPDTGSAKPDTGSTKPDNGSAKPDTGSTKPDSGSAKPDTGSAKSDTGSAVAIKPDTGSAAKPDTGSAKKPPDAGSATKPDTGSAVAIKPIDTGAPRVTVKPSAEIAAIRLSMSPNWDRDVGEAGTISLVVKVPGTDSARVFSFRYGYEDAKAPMDRDEYKKWLTANGILKTTVDRQVRGVWYLEGNDAAGAPVFRYIVVYGGRKLICGGSLYKDAQSNQLGDIRDKTIIQAKEICETVAL